MGSYEPSPGGNTPSIDRRIVLATAVPAVGRVQGRNRASVQNSAPRPRRDWLRSNPARKSPSKPQLLNRPGFIAYRAFQGDEAHGLAAAAEG